MLWMFEELRRRLRQFSFLIKKAKLYFLSLSKYSSITSFGQRLEISNIKKIVIKVLKQEMSLFTMVLPKRV